jgi:hypothetical protein
MHGENILDKKGRIERGKEDRGKTRREGGNEREKNNKK